MRNLPDFVPASDACAALGVKRETLYAYAARGLVRSVPLGGKTRARLYAREDLSRLRARSDARRGHEAVAAGALRFGEPVLETGISEITPEGPRYRGVLATELAAAGTSFERVAELLWTGTLPAERPRWPRPAAPKGLPERASPLAKLAVLYAGRGARQTPVAPESEGRRLHRARSLAAAALLIASPSPRTQLPNAHADRVATLLRLDVGAETRALVDAALVLSADHELNVSSFAARVIASSGADLDLALAGAASALTGPRHGGMAQRLEQLLAEIGAPGKARAAITERLRRGEQIPGFGHPLYPKGDPRAGALLDAAKRHGTARSRKRALSVLLAVAETVADRTGVLPTLDVGLVAAACSLGIGPHGGGLLFALGRVAGWIAHVREQQDDGVLLRPRARYARSTKAPRI